MSNNVQHNLLGQMISNLCGYIFYMAGSIISVLVIIDIYKRFTMLPEPLEWFITYLEIFFIPTIIVFTWIIGKSMFLTGEKFAKRGID